MTEDQLTDERLCWLAVRDQLRDHSERKSSGGLFALMPLGRAARIREKADEMMHEYAFAVDDASRQLKPEERQVLRQTGQVPGWFMSDVQRRAATQGR
jgi:hypothetical protein